MLVPTPCFENALLPASGCCFAGQPFPADLADIVAAVFSQLSELAAVSSLPLAADTVFLSASAAWEDIFTGDAENQVELAYLCDSAVQYYISKRNEWCLKTWNAS